MEETADLLPESLQPANEVSFPASSHRYVVPDEWLLRSNKTIFQPFDVASKKLSCGQITNEEDESLDKK